ncbi:MAG: tetratricopeptide repeat protein [Ideonella sp.]|nr:tetratricopeptide repeat protein [Ideonella sp.]
MLNFLGNIKGRVGDKRGARQAFEQVVAKDPNFRPGGINLSWLDIEEKRFDEARARLQKMLTTRADDPDVLYEIGVLELRAGRPEEALQHWKKAHEVQRADPRPGLATIDALMGQRKPDAAAAAAKSLAAAYPEEINVQLTLSQALLGNGDTAQARQALQEATRLAGFDADRQVHIGRLQLSAGNPEGASHNVTKRCRRGQMT